MVHQHFMLVPSFTVAQNVVLGREPRRGGIFCARETAREQVRALAQEYGCGWSRCQGRRAEQSACSSVWKF